MSETKIGSNQHLGVQELNRLKKFIVASGYKKTFQQIFDYYGIPKLASDPTFLNFKVVAGSSNGKLTVKAGVAVDKSLNLVSNPADLLDYLTVPGDNVIRYVKLAYVAKNEEEGKLNIATNGTLTGTGTKFTEVLRGVPFHPIKIKFTNSVSNTAEYTVVSVTNDTSAIIQGASFTAENNLTYKVVGTFTAGAVIPSQDKDIYLIDSCTITLTTSGAVTAGTEFLLARVVNNGTVTSIVDLRQNYLLQLSTASQNALGPMTGQSVLAGVESVKYDSAFSDKSKNRMVFGWGLRSSNWTGNYSTFTLTVTAGAGGIKTASTVANGDFDGWRVYFDNGTMAIVASTVGWNGSNFQLVLQNYSISAGQPNNGDLSLVPNADTIEFSVGNVYPNSTIQYSFPIQDGFAEVEIYIGLSVLVYKHVTGQQATIYYLVNDGNYYNETAFDSSGNKINNNTSSVISGVFTPVTHNRNFYQTKANLKDPNFFESFNGFAKGTVFSQTVGSGVFSNVFNLDGNFFEVTLPGTNNLEYDGFTFNPTHLPSKPVITVKFSGSTTDHFLKKKTTPGTFGFDWNSSSGLSDIVTIRPGDVYVFQLDSDGSGGVTAYLVASYSNLRYNIDSVKRRIFDPLYPKAFERL